MTGQVLRRGWQVLAGLGACIALASTAIAVTLEHGDILVVAGNRVVHVAASDSQQTSLVEFPDYIGIQGIAVSPLGEVYVTDCCGGAGQPGRILAVDPVAGSYVILAEGGVLGHPTDVALLPDGDLAVADVGALGGVGAILRIGPKSGTQDVLASSPAFSKLSALAPGAPGELFFLDSGGAAGGMDLPNAVYRLDLNTLDTTLVSRGGLLQHGLFLTYAEGFLYLPEGGVGPGGGTIVRLDPSSGAQTVIASGDLLTSPMSAAWRSAGCLVVTEQYLPNFRESGVVCVDPTSGTQGRVSSYGLLSAVLDLAVFHGGQTPTRATTWGTIKARYR